MTRQIHFYTATSLLIVLFFLGAISCQKPPLPEVHAVDPPAAKDRQRVTLIGEHLTYFNEIRIGDYVIDYQEYVIEAEHTNKQIVFLLPPGLPPGTELLYLTHDRGETEGILIDLLGPGPLIDPFAVDTIRRGEVLHIRGQYLSGPGAEVHFNDWIVTDFIEQTDTSIQVLVPQEVDPGGVSILVSINACPSNTENVIILEPLPNTPEITNLSPNPVGVGDTLTINGHYFSEGNTQVVFPNGIEVTLFSMLDTNQIKLIVPPRVQPGILQVFTQAEQAAQYPDFALLPRITSLSASAGKPGEEISLSGWNFNDFSEMRFAENILPAPQLIPPLTDTIIRIMVPDLTPNTYEISLFTLTGSSNTIPFIIQDSCNTLKPVISSVATPPFQPGDTITISGTNFQEGAIVRSQAQGLSFPVINRINEQTLLVKIPETIACGVDSLQLSTSCGNSEPFAFTVDKTPKIQPLDPSNLMPGEPIFLTGIYLNGASVRVGNQAISPSENTDLALTFELPEAFSPGDYQLRVVTTCGTSNALAITVDDPVFPPVITSLSQHCKVMGDTITIFGEHFPEMPLVLIDNIPGEIIEMEASKLVVKISEGYPGNIDGTSIMVILKDPATGIETEEPVALTLFQRPSIESFLPEANAPGGPLFLRGRNLASVQQIHFNNTASLRLSAREFLYSSSFQELGMNVPVSLLPGEVEICFDIAKGGCTVEQVCQLKRFKVTDKTSQHASPSPGNPSTIILPNPPPGISLPAVSNDWRVMVYDQGKLTGTDKNINLSDLIFKDCSDTSNPDNLQGFSDSNGSFDEPIGSYQRDGNFISIIYNDQAYEGRQHGDTTLVYTTDYQGYQEVCKDLRYPLNMVFTPVKEGDQLELIFPFILDGVEPTTAQAGLEVTLVGRGLSDVSQVSLFHRESQTKFESFDINFDDYDNKLEQRITLPNNLPHGTYELFVIDGLFGVPSNVITFLVAN